MDEMDKMDGMDDMDDMDDMDEMDEMDESADYSSISSISSMSFVSLFLFLFFSIGCSAQEWTPAQLLKLNAIKDVRVSPDNQSVIFAATQGRTSTIYRTSASGDQIPTPISSTTSYNVQPRWSPDGNWISYLSMQNNQQTLVLFHAKCNETIVFDQLKNKMQTYRWSPDSSKIAFVMPEILEIPNTISIDIDQRPYCVNRLWVIDIQRNDIDPIPITPLSYCVRGYGDFGSVSEEFDWSPEGDEIVFAHSPSAGSEDLHLTSSLAKVNLKTRLIVDFEKQSQHESIPRYSPDGQSICFLAGDKKSTYAFNRYVNICRADGKERRQLASTYNEGPFFIGLGLLGWSKDAQSILLYEPKGTKYHIESIPIDGSPSKELAMGTIFFKEPAPSPDGTFIGFVGQQLDRPPEAYIANLENFQPKQLSHLNNQFLTLSPIRTEVIKWQSIDGLEIEGLLSYPKDYRKGEKYPLLLIIHGGPMSFYDQSYINCSSTYPISTFAEAGFFVLRPNPRGSTGYGKDFRWMNCMDLGGKDYHDLMTGVDAVIEQGMADPERLGVMGWSYGGYMTAWIISQTNRFKAASMGAGISNWVSMAGTTDIPRLPSDYLGHFWDNPEFYHKKSPIFYASKVETPCLIQHGSDDQRTCVSQAYEYERALRGCGKEVRLVIYPGMGHGSSDPEMSLDLMERNVNWFREKI